jgi:hypothetical protein
MVFMHIMHQYSSLDAFGLWRGSHPSEYQSQDSHFSILHSVHMDV